MHSVKTENSGVAARASLEYYGSKNLTEKNLASIWEFVLNVFVLINARSSYAKAVLVIVMLSVCPCVSPSVCTSVYVPVLCVMCHEYDFNNNNNNNNNNIV